MDWKDRNFAVLIMICVFLWGVMMQAGKGVIIGTLCLVLAGLVTMVTVVYSPNLGSRPHPERVKNLVFGIVVALALFLLAIGGLYST